MTSKFQEESSDLEAQLLELGILCEKDDAMQMIFYTGKEKDENGTGKFGQVYLGNIREYRGRKKMKYFFSVFFTMYLVFIIFSCDAEAEKNKNADVIEVLENRDTTVIYAESIDDEKAILYRSIYPDFLFYVKKNGL